MSSMPWVKLYTEMLDDPKLADLEPEEKWLFVQLILLAGECDQDGAIPMSMRQIAWRLRVNQAELEAQTDALCHAGLIESVTDGLFVVSFGKRQGRPQSVKREQWNDAQKRARMKSEDVIDESYMTDESVIHVSSMNHSGVIPLEEIRVDKSRGDKIRVEESGARAIPDQFDSIRAMVEKNTGYPIPNSPKDIQALRELEELDIQESDIRDAIAFLRGIGKTARGPSSILASVKTAKAKRVQSAVRTSAPTLEDQGYKWVE